MTITQTKMTQTKTTPAKRTQALRLTAALVLSTLILQPTAFAAPADFNGTWVNSNVTTSGITRINISTNPDHSLSIQVFGRCTPNDCDWGKANVITYGANVSDTNHFTGTAVYAKSFANTTLVLNLSKSRLSVQSLTQFTDGSGRQNYASIESFTKYR